MADLYILCSVQLLSHVRLFVIPWTAACLASLSFTISWSLLRLMSIESVMPSNHLVICHLLLFLSSIFTSIRVFTDELLFTLGGQSIEASASASVLPMNIQGWFPLGLNGLILLVAQGTLKSLLQYHSSKASILQCSAFFYCPALTCLHDYRKNHSFDSMDLCWQSDVSAF